MVTDDPDGDAVSRTAALPHQAAPMSADILQLVSVVAGPIIPHLFSYLLIIALILSVKSHLSRKE
jgi:hypothetical protein